MPARKSRVSERHGMLLCLSEYQEAGSWFLVCECDCGKIKHIKQAGFRNTRSCGCIKATTSALNNKKHGMSGTKEYSAWDSMKDRCLNPEHPAYNNYGGRGVKVCDEWLKSFTNFFKDMGLAPSKGHSLDRVDVEGHYSPENCRWATWSEQQNNRRNNIRVTLGTETKNLYTWCKLYGVSMQFIQYRVNVKGMSYEDAFTTPKQGNNKEKQ